MTYGMLAFLGFLGGSLAFTLVFALIALALFKAKKTIPARVFSVLSLICFTLFIFSLSTFYFIPWFASALINTALWNIFFVLIRFWFPKKKLKSKVFIVALVVLVLFTLVMIWFWSFFFSGICIGFHPDEVTFAGSRLGTPDKCPSYAPAPCHVYLTLGKDISKNINVIFHSMNHYAHPIVYYGLLNTTQINSNNFMNMTAADYPLDFISQFSKRWVYYAYLDNLLPDQTYYYLVGDAGDPATYSTLKKFRTGITGGSYKFASGGDVGVEWPYPTMTTQQVAARDPLFLVLGGDIAYANGLPGCYQRWDDLMWMFQNSLVTADGRSIPLIVSIGNHEAGFVYLAPFLKTHKNVI
uniref:Purple acid phosphatase N-terminal domain-containing protein n=1 Tax=Arcella intermedia TaxID=1963864 RepID=A0A6B2L8A7_9EUKA